MKLLLLLTLFAFGFKEDQILIERKYDIKTPETFVLVVDNIIGPVTILRSMDDDIHLSLEIKMFAASDELLQEARSDLKMGEKLSEDTLILFMDAPFVNHCEGLKGFRINTQPAYDYSYSYVLKVPQNISIDVRTIDEGEIHIEDVAGAIKANNINGGLEIVNAIKVIEVGSVNGDIKVSFSKLPEEDISFHTVNGNFELEFTDDLNAKIYFDSMNGDIYTAFDYKKMAPKIERSTSQGTFKIGTKTGVEIGVGGPELTFKSINGNVYLKSMKGNRRN